MFVGHHLHTLDSKGRVVLPAKYRSELTESAYLSQAEHCLALWTKEAFENTAARLEQRVRDNEVDVKALRGFYSSSEMVTPDKQGRILLPERLREFAGLTDEVYLVGQGSHIAIWDAERWSRTAPERDASVAQAFIDGLAI